MDRQVLIALRGVACNSHVSGPLHASLPQQALQAHSATGPVVPTKVSCSQQGVVEQQIQSWSGQATELQSLEAPVGLNTCRLILPPQLSTGLGWPAPHLEAEGRVCRTEGKGRAAKPWRRAEAPAIRHTRLERAFHKPSPSSFKLHVSRHLGGCHAGQQLLHQALCGPRRFAAQVAKACFWVACSGAPSFCHMARACCFHDGPRQQLHEI